MIEYLEIRNRNREHVGIIDTAKSVIWNDTFYGVGDFEIYMQATPLALELLQVGNYVTRTDNKHIGIIERIEIGFDPENGRMITATGSFAKTLLSRRVIYSLTGNTVYPAIISGNIETGVRTLVNANMIAATEPARNVDFFELGALSGIAQRIVDETGAAARKQTSYANLQEYTDEVLQEYKIGAYVGFNRETLKLQYIVIPGVDRSVDNTAGVAPVVFSQEFDNLSSSDYSYDESALKNAVLVGGAGEGTERFYTLLPGSGSGIDRREVFVDASSQSRTYKDENEVEQTYTEAEYAQILATQGMQALVDRVIVETFAGEVDITNSGLQLGVDFDTGDLVTVQDNYIGKYITARIVGVTEVQDDDGYSISVDFGE